MESGLASRTSSATSSESSPTASSSDKDPLLSDSDEASNSRTCSVDLQKNNKNAQLASDYNKEDFPVSPVPRNEQLNDGSAIESPPTQVMDRSRLIYRLVYFFTSLLCLQILVRKKKLFFFFAVKIILWYIVKWLYY